MIPMKSLTNGEYQLDSNNNRHEYTIVNTNDVDMMNNEKSEKSTKVTWKNITIEVPLRKKSNSLMRRITRRRKGLSDDEILDNKTIINSVDGIARSSEILALMGSSGAGKTSLLNALNFRNQGNLNVSGEVRINGQLVNSVEEIASVSGYVQQDDLFIGCLTVKENLVFQAMLRMDKNYTKNERYDRVEQVMIDLNLKKCENTPVDIDGKGISGGEKRRLAFASEIITNPLILFCDEPTSGLDSFMAYSVIDSMKSLAKQGKTIICTIHQPSSEIFEMFDKLCLLAEGKLAFIGTLNEAYEFFNNQGYQVPFNYNPADFYIKNLSIIPTDRQNCLQRVNEICDGFAKIKLKKRLIEEIDEITDRHQTKNYQNEEQINFKEEIVYKTSFLVQMYWLLWRNFLVLKRNPMAFRLQVTQSTFIALLFGLIYFQLKLNQKGVQNMSGVLFLCLTNNSFGSMFVVVNTFPAEIPIFLREHQKRMYRVLSYYLSKVFMDIPIYIMLPTLFMSILYWMASLNNSIERFFTCVCLIILVSQTAVAFGTFLSACAPSTNIAIALSGPVLVPLMIFSGFLLNAEDTPKYFLFLRYLSWFGYANENLLVNQFQGVKEIACDDLNECPKLKNFETGDDVLNYFKANPDNFYFNIQSMLSLIIGWRVLTFVVLLAKSRIR